LPKRTIRITIKLSRYQQEKLLGEEYRATGIPGETFTEFKKRKKKETAEMLNNTVQDMIHEASSNLGQGMEVKRSCYFISQKVKEEKEKDKGS